MPTANFIPTLTPLRGIAAVLVVFFHFNIFLGRLAPDGNFMISKLYLMVDLFFVLSGFIMVHVYGDWFRQKIEGGHFWNFMRARFARLYPLHLFIFLYLLLWVFYVRSVIDFTQLPPVFQMVLDYSAIPGVLTLTQAWGTHMEATWNTASWSISVEWFLYLIFPLMALMISRYKKVVIPVLGLMAFSGLFLLAYAIEPKWTETIMALRGFGPEELTNRPTQTIDVITGFALLRGWCSFVFGMLAYEIYQKQKGKEILQRGFWFLLIWIGLFACWIRDVLPDPIVIPIFAVLILHGAYVEGSVKRILNNRLFTYLGDISYSIYMVHIPIIITLFLVSVISANGAPAPEETAGEVAPNFLMNWVGAIVFLLIVIGIASLTYRWIEKPARRKLKRASKQDYEPTASVSS